MVSQMKRLALILKTLALSVPVHQEQAGLALS
jgi:hypothetical protein